MANLCKTLKVVVLQPQSCTDKEKELFRTTVDFNSAVSINFDTLMNAFDMLFPTNKIIRFTII